MKKITRTKTSIIGLTFVIIWIMFNQPVLAAKWGGTPSEQDCSITEIFVDPDTNLITIYGENFNNGDYLNVTLGDDPNFLAILSYTTDTIVAELPEGLPEGDYTLIIQTGNSANQYDSYNLTIGAIGPVGPSGPQGEQGPQGPQGEQGPQGMNGTNGTDGDDGAQGPPGPQGEQGPEGPQGLRGPQGLPGPQGEKGDTGDPGPQGETGPAGADGGIKKAIADMYEGLTNSAGQVTITFPVAFTATPHFQVSGLIKSGPHAGKMAHIPKPTPGTANVTLTIQYWNVAFFDDVGDNTEVMLSYTAIEK